MKINAFQVSFQELLRFFVIAIKPRKPFKNSALIIWKKLFLVLIASKTFLLIVNTKIFEKKAVINLHV